MINMPESVAEFLRGQRIVVAGVSRDSAQPANAVFRKLFDSGYDVLPVNPNASEVEGETCYPNLAAISGPIDGVFIATHPNVSIDLVRQCSERGVPRVWFHRSFGEGSVSEEAVRECEKRGLQCIVGGCPLMYCERVDPFHRCMKWWLARRGRIPH